ncbi:restriction endonuclease subunit S [Flagellimonas marinaquae]|uniref:restriction endonuclease subunit S n=1 Tax=Flagellimonas marinaquae TaxID=254955 RepID=UPI000F8C45C4|nr:restriction endonuclease subunit S [Allomuricauda aquimarina]
MKEQKRVPKLRFAEFSGEWEKIQFSKVCDKISDGIHSTPKYNDEGNYYFVNGNNLVDGNIFINENTKRLTENEYLKHKRELNEDTILISINGTIGNLAFYNNEDIVLGKSACYINIKSKYPKYFFYLSLQTSRVKNYFNSELTGSTIKNLSLKTIKETTLILPSIREQQKIASFLSSVDKKIAQLQQKKTLLEQYKKGVMQQMFPSAGSGQVPQLRFTREDGSAYTDWEEKRLGEITKITTGNSNRVDSSLDGKYTFFDRSQDIRTSSIYLFDGEAIIVAGEGQEFIPKYFVGKFDLHQRTYAIMDFKKSNGKFLYYLIHKNRHYFYSQAVGSTVKSLRLPMFQKMKIMLPSIAEQTQIANFLSAIDKKIAVVQTQIEHTQQFKKGLLQQMFV